MTRHLLRLETSALESHINPRVLREQERRRLGTEDCRCYLARDSNGAITLFLALTFNASGDRSSDVQMEYSQSLQSGGGTAILREFGVKPSHTAGPSDEPSDSDLWKWLADTLRRFCGFPA